MLLADKKSLMNRTDTLQPMQAASLADKDGVIKGRAADGTPITGRIAGKSKARQMIEKLEAERQEKSKAEQPKPKRRRRRGGQ